jgi:hypothetical protein
MAALDFPASPTNGQVYANWIYSTAKGAWQAKPITGKVTTSAVAPAAPTNGDEWFNTNDGNLYVYYTDVDGSQWVQVKSDATLSSTLGNRVTTLETKPPGLVALTPSTITVSGGTATLSSIGTVSFTGVTSISMNNVFSSTYKHYKIIVTGIATTNGIGAYLRLRNAGTDRAIANNYYGGLAGRENGATFAWGGSAATIQDLGRFGTSSAGTNSFSVEIYNPFDVTKWTSYAFNSWSNDATSGFSLNGNGTYAYADSNDGVTIFPSSGNMTGSLQIFGFND